MKQSIALFSLLLLITVIPGSLSGQQQCRRLNQQADGRQELPTGYNELFAGSGNCLLCHNDMSNGQGHPIGILNDWRSAMMANSSKDPFWRAKVSHETQVNPGHAVALEDVCTRCHAPAGHFNAHHLGQPSFSIAEMINDSLALDGVTCTLCHQVQSSTFGHYSGELTIGTEKLIWGPYAEPFGFPMVNNTGYTPVHGDHIADSRLCGSCHTLVTQTVDSLGNLTGDHFVEQAIYHEWLNSSFVSSETSCQDCHIPRIDDTVKISPMPPWLEGRSPFGMHHLAGGNRFMQQVLKNHINELGVTALPVHFDSTISRTLRLLQDRTADLEIAESGRTTDTLFLAVTIENLTGHKFPAGFPSRRAFLEIVATTENGDTLLHSGQMDDHHQLLHEDNPYEPHRRTIRDNNEVLVYEMVMGDVYGNPTTVLERAQTHLKDNRIPPAGFSTLHPSYDTVSIAGYAADDPDFNKDNGTEGTGKDIVNINVPLLGFQGEVSITTRLHYQTVSTRWLEAMFAWTTSEIDLWKDIYEEADKEPVLIAEAAYTSLSTGSDALPHSDGISIFPNPSSGKVVISTAERDFREVVFYALNGQVYRSISINGSRAEVNLDAFRGILLVQVKDNNNDSWIRKLVIE